MHLIPWRRAALGFLGLVVLSVLSLAVLPSRNWNQPGTPGPEEIARIKAKIDSRMAAEGRPPPPDPETAALRETVGVVLSRLQFLLAVSLGAVAVVAGVRRAGGPTWNWEP